MSELSDKAEELKAQIYDATKKLKVEDLSGELLSLKKASEAADFWSDNMKAQNTMKEIAKLEQRTKPWLDIKEQIDDQLELIKLNDESMSSELGLQLETLTSRFNELKEDLKFSGPYDGNDVILNIYAGAGGTDAQDWAQMLYRMYSRWAEKNKLSINVIDESAGEEAGLKSISLEINGVNVYGKLKGEHGVHRLVRLSPFNADNLRQTSFAKVDVLPKIDKPDDINIDDKDLRVDVYRSGGHGGQSVNTTDSAVRITHLPTNISVAIQNERSQLQNKELAMTILRSRLAQLQLDQHAEKLSELKGPVKSAEWGNQIRSYVLHPYKQVKDLRSKYETNDPDSVLDGSLDNLINAYLDFNLNHK